METLQSQLKAKLGALTSREKYLKHTAETFEGMHSDMLKVHSKYLKECKGIEDARKGKLISQKWSRRMKRTFGLYKMNKALKDPKLSDKQVLDLLDKRYDKKAYIERCKKRKAELVKDLIYIVNLIRKYANKHNHLKPTNEYYEILWNYDFLVQE